MDWKVAAAGILVILIIVRLFFTAMGDNMFNHITLKKSLITVGWVTAIAFFLVLTGIIFYYLWTN